MDIELSRLSHAPQVLAGDLVLAGPGAGDAGGGVRWPEPFRLDGTVRLSGGHVVVAGRVTGAVSLECGRCLAWFDFPVDVAFESRYAPAGSRPAVPETPARRHPARVPDDEAGIELSAEDLDVSFLPKGAMVLSAEEVAREQVLLEIPLRPLCRDACKGLCRRCGADLNAGACGCPAADEGPSDPRLEPLAALRRRLEGE